MNGNSLCGAVLISPRFALTAAHCMNAAKNLDIGAENRFGEGAIEIPFDVVKAHPDYDRFTYENDIALLELKEDAMMMDGNGDLIPAGYAKLHPDKIDDEDVTMTVIGFGDINPKEEETDFSDTLQEVEVTYVDGQECNRDYGGGISEEMMCAEAPGKDACYGDSGGPLLLAPTDDAEDDEVVGLVSWGIGCADDNYPGVYTRVSYFYDWIVEAMCETGKEDVPSYVNCTDFLPPTEPPTQAPSALPTLAPTLAPSEAPPPTDLPVCKARNAPCENSSECCSRRCNIFQKKCASPTNGNRNRLSLGLGGSAGGTIQRGKRTSPIEPGNDRQTWTFPSLGLP